MTNTIRFTAKSVSLFCLALALTACGNTKEYSSIEPGQATERSRANLELPPDLVQSSSDELAAGHAAQQSEVEEEEVLPEVKGLDVTRNDQEGWLEVNASPDKVWRRLVAHWGALGVDLVVSDPKAGIMETDWVAPVKSQEEDPDLTDSLLKQFLGRLVDETTALDKFTLRLERVGDGSTRIYVDHRGIKKIQTRRTTVATNAEWEWVETEEDPAKVRRAMSSIVYGLENGAS